jgi:hypothetical protein
MNGSNRCHAMIGRVNQLRLYGMGHSIADDCHTAGIFKARNQASMVHFTIPVMGIVAGIKKHTHD